MKFISLTQHGQNPKEERKRTREQEETLHFLVKFNKKQS